MQNLKGDHAESVCKAPFEVAKLEISFSPIQKLVQGRQVLLLGRTSANK